MTHSYVHGPSHIPLLGETIGECLDRITVACGERDALISCHQRVRYTYSELHREAEAMFMTAPV